MLNIKNMFLKRNISTLLNLISVVFIVIFFIGYMTSSITVFNKTYSLGVIIPTIICMVLGIAFTLFEVKIGRYAIFCVMLYVLFNYVNTQTNYIANVFTGIDGSSFTFGFIITLLSILICVITSLISGILAKEECVLLKGDSSNDIE